MSDNQQNMRPMTDSQFKTYMDDQRRERSREDTRRSHAEFVAAQPRTFAEARYQTYKTVSSYAAAGLILGFVFVFVYVPFLGVQLFYSWEHGQFWADVDFDTVKNIPYFWQHFVVSEICWLSSLYGVYRVVRAIWRCFTRPKQEFPAEFQYIENDYEEVEVEQSVVSCTRKPRRIRTLPSLAAVRQAHVQKF
jgi:hypothetical protein